MTVVVGEVMDLERVAILEPELLLDATHAHAIEAPHEVNGHRVRLPRWSRGTLVRRRLAGSQDPGVQKKPTASMSRIVSPPIQAPLDRLARKAPSCLIRENRSSTAAPTTTVDDQRRSRVIGEIDA